MSNSLLTKDLIQKASGLIKVEPEIADNTGRFSMFDSGAVSCEDGELLYALARIQKPERILTTGTFTGVSDLYLAQALKDNGFGEITAIEYEETHKNRAEKLWKLCGVQDYVTCVLQSSIDFQPEGIYDLMFLDTELHLRWGELLRFFSHLKEGGYVLIHDFHRHLYKGSRNEDHPEIEDYPAGPVPEQIRKWVKEDKLRVTHFDTPRGMVMLYKVHTGDYRWE